MDARDKFYQRLQEVIPGRCIESIFVDDNNNVTLKFDTGQSGSWTQLNILGASNLILGVDVRSEELPPKEGL